MSRSRGGLAAVAFIVVWAALSESARPEEAGTPLPWSTFPAGSAVSDAQPFECPSGAHGLKMKLRDDAGDTYGYFSLMGERWIVVRYPRDEMGDPDHIWFGTSPAARLGSMDVSHDEPFDGARHGSPCAGWLIGAPPDEHR